MKIAKIMATCALSLALFTGCTVGKGIITVNGEGISKSQYDKMYAEVSKSPQFQMIGDAAKDPDNFFTLMARDRIVNELIIKKLFEQEVKKRNITVSKEEIAAQKIKITEGLGGEAKLKELMLQNGITEKKLEEDIINEVKMSKLVESSGNVNVSDKDVKDFYNENKAQFNYPDRVRASHILISANPAELKQAIIDGDKKGELSAAQIDAKVKEEMDKKMALAKEVKEKAAKNPAEFAKLAKQYSDDKGSAIKGGDLGFFPREAMVKPFSDAAFSLKVNTVSDVVVSQFGNHIIVVTDRAKAGLEPFDKVAPEIRGYLEQTKKITALQKLFDGIKASAKVVYNDPSFDPANIQTKIREKAAAQAKGAPAAPEADKKGK